VRAEHTSAHRAEELETFLREARARLSAKESATNRGARALDRVSAARFAV
jgi:hypothetical protein